RGGPAGRRAGGACRPPCAAGSWSARARWAAARPRPPGPGPAGAGTSPGGLPRRPPATGHRPPAAGHHLPRRPLPDRRDPVRVATTYPQGARSALAAHVDLLARPRDDGPVVGHDLVLEPAQHPAPV